MPSSSFTVNAWIRGSRWKHHRIRDHHGVDSDLNVVLSSTIGGRYPGGMTVHAVLADMVARVAYLTDDHITDSFTIDAVIHGLIFTVDAVVKKSPSGSFTLNAFINRKATFTIDAYVVGKFTIDAFLV